MQDNLELHKPVLLESVLSFCQGFDEPVELIMDLTFGRGGHCLEMAALHPDAKVVAFDQDKDAIEYGEKMWAQKKIVNPIQFFHANFSQIDQYTDQINQFCSGKKASVILVDLGVSSPQLDTPERGFSFYHNGPLDMRMNRDDELTAADIVNNWDEDELTQLFIKKGEVRNPGRVVQLILKKRMEKKFETTEQLSLEIESCLGWRKKGQHPATQYFLALRMEVNKELEVVEESLVKMLKFLGPGGRLQVITFHSLEDRIVKYKFKELDKVEGKILTKKVIQATWDQKKKNKRARSAKLRVFEKGDYNEAK